jgi:hypothetical protein
MRINAIYPPGKIYMKESTWAPYFINDSRCVKIPARVFSLTRKVPQLRVPALQRYVATGERHSGFSREIMVPERLYTVKSGTSPLPIPET